MEVQTVTMDQDAAQSAFKEYRAAFMAERNRIDGELMRGYKALAEGKTLISLTEALQAAGADDFGRPKIAIARADETAVLMRRGREGDVTYRPPRATRRSQWGWNQPVGPLASSPDRRFEFPVGTLPELTASQEAAKISVRRFNDTAWNQEWEASLPFIPPQYRPPHGLVNYHLLWEAEWRLAAGSQRLDPILLKRIGGDLFAVVAAWELTEVEKLVLAR